MRRIFLSSLIMLLWSGPVFCQVLEVLPGDATNNGVINNLDFLEIGLGYNFAGPNRGTAVVNNLNLTPQIVSPWPLSLPGGLNMAYADCDGSGKVDFNDLNPIYINYGAQRSDIPITPDVFVPGLFGLDPALGFPDDAATMLDPGEHKQIPIVLGTASLPVEDLYGIAFSIHFNEQVAVDQVRLDLSPSSWANNDGDRIFFYKRSASKRIDAAWTRTDRNNRSGFGEIGTLELVIIVDVIDRSMPVRIWTDSIRMIDKFGNITAVVGDTINFTLNPDAFPTAIQDVSGAPFKLTVQPNPARNTFQVVSDLPMQHISLFNLLGNQVLSRSISPSTQAQVTLPDLPNGPYLLKVETDKGPIKSKINIFK
ncbi:T9SS type A sorting domain-containing protein [Runella sp.]|uniref:T9SS type A sorting domain-containing protein n=1 Tax=Runella sp. TaxID=1960881 RepID=UPI0030196011